MSWTPWFNLSPPDIPGFYSYQAHYFCNKCNKMVGFSVSDREGIYRWSVEGKLEKVVEHVCAPGR